MNDKTPLETQLRKLRHEIEPEHDLWPGIESRLRPRRRRRGLVGLAAGAAAVAVLAVVLLGQQLPQHDSSPSLAQTSHLSDRASIQRAALGRYALDNSQLDQPTRQVVAQNLAIIHTALGNIRAALAENPNDSRLQSLLLAVEQQEAELLSQAQQAGAESRYHYARTDI